MTATPAASPSRPSIKLKALMVSTITKIVIRSWANSLSTWIQPTGMASTRMPRSEEHTSELQSRFDLVCRLLLEKKKNKKQKRQTTATQTPRNVRKIKGHIRAQCREQWQKRTKQRHGPNQTRQKDAQTTMANRQR